DQGGGGRGDTHGLGLVLRDHRGNTEGVRRGGSDGGEGCGAAPRPVGGDDVRVGESDGIPARGLGIRPAVWLLV
ncbi:hypothetical protein GW17_00005207, partial [Ensete ventricosum]